MPEAFPRPLARSAAGARPGALRFPISTGQGPVAVWSQDTRCVSTSEWRSDVAVSCCSAAEGHTAAESQHLPSETPQYLHDFQRADFNWWRQSLRLQPASSHAVPIAAAAKTVEQFTFMSWSASHKTLRRKSRGSSEMIRDRLSQRAELRPIASQLIRTHS